MNELTLKVTRLYELPDNFVKLNVKDAEDNLPQLKTAKTMGPRFDVIHVIDNNAETSHYYICNIEGMETTLKDGDWNVLPLTFSYSHKGV